MSISWKIKAVQLDLARQMETLEFIKEFIEMIKQAGHNTLFLYLEGRVRTASFNSMPDSEAYTIEEMCEIVSFAAAKSIEVIPCVSLHGHGELFMKHPEFKDFSELRNGRAGRWGNNENFDFCPNHEGFKKFFEQYLVELCKIFPSQYFHIGLDEVWNIGFCDLCKTEASSYEGEGEIYLKNIKYWHKVLDALGKRVMMWDDMLEYYPDILKNIPRDVIMVQWQYQKDVRHFKGHFVNLPELDLLAEYDRLKFDYMIAPSDYSTSNIRTATNYAGKFSPIGGLVTSWTKQNCFYYRSFPAFVYAGYLWQGLGNNNTMEAVCMQIFGIKEKLFIQAVKNFTEIPNLSRDDSISVFSLMQRPYFGLDYKDYEMKITLKSILTAYSKSIKGELGNRVLDSIIQTLNYMIAEFNLKILSQKAVDDGAFSKEDSSKFMSILNEIEYLGIKQSERWNRYRKNILPNIITERYQKLIEKLRNFPSEFNHSSKLRIRFCQPDQYGAQQLTIKLLENGHWHQTAQGSFKSSDCQTAIYEQVFFTSIRKPEAIRIEYKGFGGQGICYAEFDSDKTKYIPTSVMNGFGEYANPVYFMNNDCKYCFMGNQDIRNSYQKREAAETLSYCEWKIEKINNLSILK